MPALGAAEEAAGAGGHGALAAGRYAGVVDEDVDRAQRSLYPGYAGPHRLKVGHVEGHPYGPAARRRDLGGHGFSPILEQVVHRYPHALFRQRQAYLPADASSCSRYQRHTVTNAQVHRAPPYFYQYRGQGNDRMGAAGVQAFFLPLPPSSILHAVDERLAIDGGPKVRQQPFPPWPALGEDDVAAVADVLRSGRLTQLTGDAVAAFEATVAAWHGVRHCVATSSGTTAIHAALAALDVGPGDEVIVPAHTFIASATPVLHQGAVPIFADVDPRTFCLDPYDVEQKIGPRTRAIIAVHLNGHPADLDPLLAVGESRGIAIIEDAAQAHGALYKGRKVGTIGRLGCFSFWEDKIVTTAGEGGCVITDDDALAERLRRFRHHGEGQTAGERAYYHLDLGHNYRMTAVQAATGLVQFRRLDEYLAARRRNAAYLTDALAQIDAVEPPYVADYAVHSYYKYVCRLSPGAGIGIAEFVAAVAAEGVPISRRYPTPLTHQPVFHDRGLGREPCPVAESLSGQLFTLLVHPTVGARDLDDVVEAIRKVIRASN